MAKHDVRTNNHSGLWENWVIDVTKWPEFCFYPKEEDGSIVTGMIYVGEKCPGKLVDVVHSEGREFADIWRKNNPEWHRKHRADAPTNSDKDDWIKDPRIKFTGTLEVQSKQSDMELAIPDYEQDNELDHD